MEKFIFDRCEGDFAVLERESGGTLDVDMKLLNGAKEGDVLIFENNSYTVCPEETEMRKKKIEEKMNKLFKK